jgi:hypothetical protein
MPKSQYPEETKCLAAVGKHPHDPRYYVYTRIDKKKHERQVICNSPKVSGAGPMEPLKKK